MILVDSHSHIFAEEFDFDRRNVIERAADVGIKYHILPNIDSKTSAKLLEVSEEFNNICYPLMGIHPTSIAKHFEDELAHVEWNRRDRNRSLLG